MDLNAHIESISSDQLDALFGGTPILPDPKPSGENKKDDVPAPKQDDTNLPFIDMDKFEELETPATPDKIDNKTPAVDPDKKDDTNKDDIKTDDKKTDELTDDQKLEIAAALKNTASYLIEKGIWKDFEGREDLDFSDETYAELSAQQAQEKVNDMFSELVDSTGSYGKAIISHIKNGGNPDEIIDLFKEQKAIENFDTSSDIGKKILVEKYYSEVVGWSKAKVDKYISSLVGQEDGLDSEIVEVQEKFDQLYSKQLEEIQQQQAQEKTRIENEQREYFSNLAKTIDTFEEFTDTDKRTLKDSVLKLNKKLKDGTPVSDFYIKFQAMQKDPKQYVKLIHFVVDPEGFLAKVQAKEQTRAVEKSWNFVKGNSSIKKGGSSNPDNDSSNKGSKLDLSSAFKFKK